MYVCKKLNDVLTALVGRHPTGVLSHQDNGYAREDGGERPSRIIDGIAITKDVRFNDNDGKRNALFLDNGTVDLHRHHFLISVMLACTLTSEYWVTQCKLRKEVLALKQCEAVTSRPKRLHSSVFTLVVPAVIVDCSQAETQDFVDRIVKSLLSDLQKRAAGRSAALH